MAVVNEDQVEQATQAIREAAFSGYTGNGKIFVSPVDSAYSIRTGKAEL